MQPAHIAAGVDMLMTASPVISTMLALSGTVTRASTTWLPRAISTLLMKYMLLMA